MGGVTREIDLAWAGGQGLCPAGVGPRVDPARSGPDAWDRRLYAWGISPPSDPGYVRRVWLIRIRPHLAEMGKIERTLPSGRRIRVFAEGLAAMHASPHRGTVDGPRFYLTFEDAEMLWRDKHVSVQPACG